MTAPYPVLPYLWTLDGVVFNSGDGKYVNRARGWQGRTEPRTNKTPRVAGDGDYLGNTYWSARTIEIEGFWRTNSRAERFAAMDTLCELFGSLSRASDYPIRRTEDTRDRLTFGRLDDVLNPEVGASGLITFETQLICSDYRWWSASATEWQPTGLAVEGVGGVLWNGGLGTSGDGVLWNGGLGTSGGGVEYQQGAPTGGSTTITNTGNDWAPVVFTMAATGGSGLSSPWVSISGTGETIQWDGLLAVGSSVTVDTGTSGVRLDNAPINGGLLRADMFQVPPRSTRTITFGSTAFGDQGLLTGRNYNGYQGG